jgi:PhnB protein
MRTANPYLNFPGNTLEAFEFYRSVMGGEFAGVMRYRDFDDEEMQVPEADLDRIAHIALPLGPDTLLMGTDTLASMGHTLTPGNNFYIALEADSPDEATRVFDDLSAGGRVEMALQSTSWARLYGSLTDRFGVQWMVMYTGEPQGRPGDGAGASRVGADG